MAQQIKVQDGVVVYSTPDPSTPVLTPNTPTGDIDFLINGQLSVSLELSIGNDPLADGSIISPVNTDIVITPGKNLNVQTPSGSIVLNNVVWPDGTVSPTPGMYLGASALNTLQFYALPAPAAPNYQYFDAAAAQTVFNTVVSTTANGGGKAYLQLFVNGTKQIEGALKDYQVTGPNQVTFNTGLSLNDAVEFYAYS
jgi:hypothetical protein